MIRPGAIGLVPTPGWAGVGIKLGEELVDGACMVQHAFLLLDDGTVIGAQPKGARIQPLSDYAKMPVTWIDRDLSPHARSVVVALARKREGEGYNWWAYVWLACVRVGLRPKWVRRLMNNPHNDMCSQMVDHVYQDAANDPTVNSTDQALLHLFNDGRDPGNVTPGDLYPLATTNGVHYE